MLGVVPKILQDLIIGFLTGKQETSVSSSTIKVCVQ